MAYSRYRRNRYSPAATYCQPCGACGRRTSKSYARTHDGKCKACATGVEPEYRGPKCPQCDGPRTRYQELHRYVCDACTRANDPEGYRMEVMGYFDSYSDADGGL